MSIDIGIDFTVNTGRPRVFALTDWECRLVEHCLTLYVEAAEACDDITLPLAVSALGKVAGAPASDEGVPRLKRRGLQSREKSGLVDWPDEQNRWRLLVAELAERLETAAPERLADLTTIDGSLPLTEWLAIRRAYAAEKEERLRAERASA